MKTLVDLSNDDTLIVMSYEQRSTGDKPEIEKEFFQVLMLNIPYSDNCCLHVLLQPSKYVMVIRLKYMTETGYTATTENFKIRI